MEKTRHYNKTVLFRVSSNVSQFRDLLLTQLPLIIPSINHLSTNHLYRKF